MACCMAAAYLMRLIFGIRWEPAYLTGRRAERRPAVALPSSSYAASLARAEARPEAAVAVAPLVTVPPASELTEDLAPTPTSVPVPERPSPGRPRVRGVIGVVVAALAEIAVAALLVRLLWNAGADSMHGHSMMSTASGLRQAAATGSTWLVFTAILGAVAAAALVLRTSPPRSAGALGLAAVATSPLVGWTSSSHFALMAQLETLVIGVPLLLVPMDRMVEARRPGRPVVQWLAGAGVLLAVATVVVWHLRGLHDHVATPGAVAVRTATLALAGLTLWAGLSARVSSRVRLPLLFGFAEVGGLLGLMMLLSGGPLRMAGSLDGRLAGVLMMVVDLAVLVPLLLHLRGRTGERASGMRRAIRRPLALGPTA